MRKHLITILGLVGALSIFWVSFGFGQTPKPAKPVAAARIVLV